MAESTTGVGDLLTDGNTKVDANVNAETKTETNLETKTETDAKPESKSENDSNEIDDLLEGKKEEKKPERVAPEKYEFKLEESIPINKELLGGFEKLAKELNMPQDEAQKVIDFHVQNVKAIQNEYLNTQKEWHNESVKYFSELGNGDVNKGLEYVAAFKNKFMDAETKTFLKEAGINNNLHLLKLFDKVGRLVSEDKLVDGKDNNKTPISDTELWYGKK